MFSVTFVNHSERVMDLLNRKLLACVRAAAVELGDSYKFGLQREYAPPHSRLGEIPHAYMGHKTGGYGPVLGADNTPNNTPESGFAAVQGDFLSSYIEGDASSAFGSVDGWVGFSPQGSHVQSRLQNYLLKHDRNGRPWVRPIFDRNRKNIASAAKTAFEGTE
jgi:hypothetical protein